MGDEKVVSLFSSRRDVTEKKGKPDKKDTSLTGALEHAMDVMGLDGNEVFSKTLITIRMQEYLQRLQGIINAKLVNEHREKLKLLSQEELAAIAEKSSEPDWQKNPAYYTALSSVIGGNLP